MKIALLYATFFLGIAGSEEFSTGVVVPCPGKEQVEISIDSTGDQAMRIANEYALGVCRDKDREWFWLRLAALLNSEEASGSLGEILIRPGPGSAEWYEGISLLMRASEQGDSVSSLILATALGAGDELAPATRRRYWLTRSAEQGSTTAMTELARDELKATPRDEARLAQALHWVTLACQQSMMGSVSHKDACAVRDALQRATDSASASGE